MTCCDRAFLIIDALDACSAETRADLSRVLQSLSLNVAVLGTCRNAGSFDKLLPTEAILDITAQDVDVKRYVQSRIAQCWRLQNFVTGVPDVELQLCKAVVEKGRGMSVTLLLWHQSCLCHIRFLPSGSMLTTNRFLIARLHMDSITQSERRRDIIHNLRELPDTVDLAFDKALRHIRANHHDLVLRVLGWILHAKEPMTAPRMQHALAIEKYHERFSDFDAYPIDFLLEICNGLVQQEPRSQRINFVHFSLRDFLGMRATVLFPDFDAYVARTCFRCIMSYDLHQAHNGVSQLRGKERRAAALSFIPFDDEMSIQRSISLGLVGYAIRHGISHAAKTHNQETDQLLRRIFDGSPCFAEFSELHIYLSGGQRGTGLNVAPALTSYNELCLSICLGLPYLTRWLLQKGINPNISSFSSTGWISPLALAAWYDNTATVMDLIQQGAELDSSSTLPITSSQSGRTIRLLAVTPLEIAALRGATASLRILIASSATCDSKEQDKRHLEFNHAIRHFDSGTLSKESCSIGHHADMVPPLHRSSCPIPENPLMPLTALDDSDVVDRRSLPSRVESCRRTETVFRDPVVFFLLLHTGPYVCTPLQILLEEGLIDPNVINSNFDTPLHALVGNYVRLGRPDSIVEALLQAGADPNPRNCRGHTPLHLAASLGARNLARILITYGATKDTRNESRRTPVDVAKETSEAFSTYLSALPGPPQPSQGEGQDAAEQITFLDDANSGRSPISATFDVVSLYEDSESQEPESIFSRRGTPGSSFTLYDDKVDFLPIREVMERHNRYRASRKTWCR